MVVVALHLQEEKKVIALMVVLMAKLVQHAKVVTVVRLVLVVEVVTMEEVEELAEIGLSVLVEGVVVELVTPMYGIQLPQVP